MSESKVSEAKRVFNYGSLKLDDPAPTSTPEEVKEFYSGIYPELTQAIIEGPEYKDNTIVYTLRKAVGTKGAFHEDQRRYVNTAYRARRFGSV